ncbi:MAG TPA: CBS domain-containing protein [Defluviitaleaceae bacterium]|nr:CBS domain-containing protein [Candidatus Epulonipiscium sp.]HOQ17076.1 CBS domain-containing protein [Defluviitaleaceae bacterium]HPT76250.1 CBS domain-containing protein [Defluviitaleaceae bacterium]HQD51406.1 CBS domain-containing protein [Defluviitaleaceae bacterium]
MKVRDIMTQNVISVDEEESVLRASQVMRDANVGSVPVVRGDKLVGIITDRDIVVRNVADGEDVDNVTCKNIMTTDLVTCSPDMDVDEVAALMSKHQVRRIPVVENGKVVGMVSLGDLATQRTTQDEAEEALKNISSPSMPEYQ